MNEDLDIGEKSVILCPSDALEILKVFSTDTRINKVPKLIAELIGSNKKITLEAIKYAPVIYFYLPSNMRKNKLLMREAIRAYHQKNKISNSKS